MNDDNDSLDYKPQRMSLGDAKDLVRRQSSKILDIAKLRGEVSPAAPHASLCKDVEHGYRVNHWWSVVGPSVENLKEAMDRLHRELPKQGWKVYRYGHANSKARQLRLEAEDKKDHHTVTIELSLPSTYPDPSKWEKKMRDSISISLASPCYVDKNYEPNDQ
ncbi:hypothetical protein [Streptomyces hygroscopicus]|uniref:hypothetical protein n=1 Tax=Streptomyces hygroscopicus TaxID=1912 RepID=UPI000AB2CDB3|nr:hypothetical protein [Streptomyces hygroscopicus]